MAIFSSLYRPQLEKLIALRQTFMGIAMITGPLLGMVLEALLGFAAVFLAFGIVALAALPVLMIYVPADLPAEDGKEAVEWRQLLRVKVYH